MALDVETPDPPDLTNRGMPDHVDPSNVTDGLTDLRREELEEILRDGAWNEAFREWAAYTDLTETEYRTIDEQGLIQEVDLYWDPTEERLRFELPAFPAELAERTAFATAARTELADLGDAVIEMIQDAYIDWSDEETEPWTEELFDEEPTGGGPTGEGPSGEG